MKAKKNMIRHMEQAAGCSWLHLFTVQNIVSKVGYCDRLKAALYQRLSKEDLSIEQRETFTRIKDWLVFEYITSKSNDI